MTKFKSNEWMYSSEVAISCLDKYKADLASAGVGSFVVLDEPLITELSGQAGDGLNPHIISGKIQSFKGKVLSANPALSAVPTSLVLTYREFGNGDFGIQETWNRRGAGKHGKPAIKRDPGVLSCDYVNCVNLNYDHADLLGSRYDEDLNAYQSHLRDVSIGRVYKSSEVYGDPSLEYWQHHIDVGWDRIQEYLNSGRQIK